MWGRFLRCLLRGGSYDPASVFLIQAQAVQNQTARCYACDPIPAVKHSPHHTLLVWPYATMAAAACVATSTRILLTCDLDCQYTCTHAPLPSSSLHPTSQHASRIHTRVSYTHVHMWFRHASFPRCARLCVLPRGARMRRLHVHKRIQVPPLTVVPCEAGTPCTPADGADGADGALLLRPGLLWRVWWPWPGAMHICVQHVRYHSRAQNAHLR